MLTYWDSSALVKLYAHETDSEYFLDLLAQSGQLRTSAIAETEIAATLLRKERAGLLKPGATARELQRFRADCATGLISVIPYTSAVAAESERVARLALETESPLVVRSLDLIHAASASLAGVGTFVGTDRRLCALMALLDIPVVPKPIPVVPKPIPVVPKPIPVVPKPVT